jgi:SAM-dependent methyltransferase
VSARTLAGRVWQATFCEVVHLLSRLLVRSSADDPFHHVAHFLAEEARRRGVRTVLELGARRSTIRHIVPDSMRYVGFDIHPGPDVDVVGDIHELSRHFEPEAFDLVCAISTFEHLAMPWKAILEINKVLRPEGLLFINTHPTWPPHEVPWDFWRFSAEAFRVLLGPPTGFEILRSAEGLPCMILPLGTEPAMRGMHRVRAHLGVSVVARKVGPPRPGLAWDVAVAEVLSTTYPVA